MCILMFYYISALFSRRHIVHTQEKDVWNDCVHTYVQEPRVKYAVYLN